MPTEQIHLERSTALVLSATVRAIEEEGWTGKDGLIRILDYQIATGARHHSKFYELKRRVYERLFVAILLEAHEESEGVFIDSKTVSQEFLTNMIRNWEHNPNIEKKDVISALKDAEASAIASCA